MKKAVILFNLGGPDKLESVQPFLFNLFNDKAIIGLPNPFRKWLANFISTKREPKAQGIYKEMGGKSPILDLTLEQARELEKELGSGYRVLVSMRYWHPMSAEIVTKLKELGPEEVILLPLYPQFSTTTTASSFADWKSHNLPYPTRKVCCYHSEKNFIDAHAELIRPQLEQFPEARVLFSAHGIPEKCVKAGDPYQWQVEKTSQLVAEKLKLKDWRVCYQSKVGPLPWLKPNTTDEIAQAGKDAKDIILVPISFVSEHSETLVELDIWFKKLAEENGVKNYARIPALGTNWHFIKSLAALVKNEAGKQPVCPNNLKKCACLSA